LTDRTTKVTLTAQVSQYLAGMDAAARKTNEFAAGSTQKLAAQKQAFTSVGTAMLAIGAVAAAGVGLAVKSFADFDAKMSQVKTLSHATAKEMNDLGTAALTLGQKIGFSATQVADAEIELVKAGISTKDIMGGALKGALELAAAGQIDVGNATEIATIALTQFNLKGKDVPHVADLLAAGADKALGGVSDLGEALKSGGLVASQFGVSLNETVGTLSAFANAGLIGETAGTDLRQMLLKLASPSAEAASTMKSLGINIYDASGKFVGMSGLAGQLADKMGKLDPATRNAALSTIFGSRAIAGANVLYKEGAKGIGDWTNKVNDTGFAAQQASGKMDNLQGDLKKLGAVFETDLIKTGSTANGVMRDSVQAVTALATAYGDLPKPAQGAILAVGALVAGIGLVGGTAFLAVPKIAAFRAALVELGTSMRTVSLAGGAVGLAIAALVQILASVAEQQAKADAAAQGLADTLDKQTGAVTKNSRAFVANQLQKDGTLKLAKEMGLAEKTVVDAYLQQPAALEKVRKALSDTKDVNGEYVKGLIKNGLTGDDLIKGTKALNDVIGEGAAATRSAKERTKELSDANVDSAQSTQTAADTYQSAADKAKDLADQIQNLTDEINKANGVGQDAISTNASYQDALSKVQDTIKQAKAGVDGYSTSLDTTTAAGADNAAMFSDLASKSQAAAKAQFDVDHNAVQYRENLKAGRQTLIDQITALTGNAAAAQTLADKIYAIPSEKEVQLLVNTADAEVQLAKLNAHLNQVAATRTATINVVTNSDGSTARGMIARAGGGPVYGPGTSTSDSVLLRASAGEYVINADAYAKNKALVEAINNGTSLSAARLSPAPQQYASAPSLAAPVSVQVVSNGIDLSGFLDVFVDGKLQRADRATSQRVRAGVRP